MIAFLSRFGARVWIHHHDRSAAPYATDLLEGESTHKIAPGLIARFSRQFGQDPYDEATVEYYLSRILRIRATFSDAGTLLARSPFRRIERAGIDLLFSFSF